MNLRILIALLVFCISISACRKNGKNTPVNEDSVRITGKYTGMFASLTAGGDVKSEGPGSVNVQWLNEESIRVDGDFIVAVSPDLKKATLDTLSAAYSRYYSYGSVRANFSFNTGELTIYYEKVISSSNQQYGRFTGKK
jgi:hypothetical protein